MDAVGCACKFRLPHIIKIAEAYSAIADERIEVDGQNQYFVFSSDFTKKYTVMIKGGYYSSNDNMSYNHDILGYPIVVVLMLNGLIQSNSLVAKRFQNICWTRINLECKKDFSKSLQIVLKKIGKDDNDIEQLKKEINLSYKQLIKLSDTIYHVKGNISFAESIL